MIVCCAYAYAYTNMLNCIMYIVCRSKLVEKPIFCLPAGTSGYHKNGTILDNSSILYW